MTPNTPSTQLPVMSSLCSGKQIFVCFSGKDRHTCVKDAVCGLQDYGVDVWYDYQQSLLGDKLEFHEQLQKASYAIVFFTDNFYGSKIANEELKHIRQRVDNQSLHLFPLFFHGTIGHLKDEYRWISLLKYKEVYDNAALQQAIKQIVCKLLVDEFAASSCHYFFSDEFYCSDVVAHDGFLKEAISTYRSLSNGNYSARVATVYMLYTYFKTHLALNIRWREKRAIERICQAHNYEITQDNREITILETALSLITNQLL